MGNEQSKSTFSRLKFKFIYILLSLILCFITSLLTSELVTSTLLFTYFSSSSSFNPFPPAPHPPPPPPPSPPSFCSYCASLLHFVSLVHSFISLFTDIYSLIQGRSQDFSKGGSHCVKHYRHGVFATEYCRLFA